MRLRPIRIIAPLATLVAVLSCGGADGLAPMSDASSSGRTLRDGLYASGPVATGNIALDRMGANGSAAPSAEEVSWVSLVPGTVPDGATATIVNLQSGERATVPIVEGGFDPYPIPVNMGDTVQVAVSRVGKPDAAASLSVSARTGPKIVRSRPPRGQTDAPLNTIITLVFTEPLAPASVNPTTVSLMTTAGSPIAGRVRILPGPGYTVEFTPSALLTPSTGYSLTVNGVLSLAGTPLAASTSIAFTTAGTVGSGSAIVPYGQAVREILVGSHFLANGLVASGSGVSLPTDWRSRDPSIATVVPLGNSYGYVVGIRPGTTFIEGSALGATATIAVTVLPPAPASTVSPVVVDFRMLEVRYDPASSFWSYAPEIVLVDTTGRGGSAILGVSFDLPGLGGSPTCIMDRAVGSDPLTVFHESYGDFELTIDGGGTRASGSEALAHVTLRVPGPAAMTIDVRGPIVPGSVPTGYSAPLRGDVLSCG